MNWIVIYMPNAMAINCTVWVCVCESVCVCTFVAICVAEQLRIEWRIYIYILTVDFSHTEMFILSAFTLSLHAYIIAVFCSL